MPTLGMEEERERETRQIRLNYAIIKETKEELPYLWHRVVEARITRRS